MPRAKKKRERDPKRSHRPYNPSPQLRPTSRRTGLPNAATSGAGWVCGRCEQEHIDKFLKLEKDIPSSGRGWLPHSGYFDQGNDKPMLQFHIDDKKRFREQWLPLVQEQLAALKLQCPCCQKALQSHAVVAIDLNRIEPGAALWPHTDFQLGIGVNPVTVITLLQPAQQGGLFSVAKEATVAWTKSAVHGSARLARSGRDMLLVDMFECGDVCVLNGARYAHCVSRVTSGLGSVARKSLSVTVRCLP